MYCYSVAVKQDGTVYGLLDIPARTSPQIVQFTSTTSYTRVDGGANATPAYSAPNGISWDFVNQRILVFDTGADQSTARIFSIDPATGTRAFISNGSAGPTATYAGAFMDGPEMGYRNTANRIVYMDGNLDASPTSARLSTVGPSSPTASQYYTGATASSANSQFGANAQELAIIPPTLPAITSPTVARGGTTATLGANVTSTGVAIVTPSVQARGVVYSLTSANTNPKIGGANVTQVAAGSTGTGTLTVSASGLTVESNYSYAGYVSTYYGTTYTTVGTFTAAAAPTVTSPTATNITGTTATLGGNVTSDGAATITARGVVYAATATNSMPTVGGTGVTNLTVTGTTGVFTVNATGLSSGAQYSYRAYATNSVGTTYAASTSTTLTPPTANTQTVSVAFNTATAVTLSGSDPDSPALSLTYTVVTTPTHGTLSGTAPT